MKLSDEIRTAGRDAGDWGYDDWADEVAKLEAVAVAAKGVLWTNNDEMLGETSFHKQLREALSVAEDLLEE